MSRRGIPQADRDGVETSGGWPVFVLSNHDIVRSYNRYGDGMHNDEIAKVHGRACISRCAARRSCITAKRSAWRTTIPRRSDEVKDPIGTPGWPEEKGRDGERTPMQWTTATNAGFSTATPWLPVAPNYKTHNVQAESKEPDSMLNFYKRVLALRRDEPALKHGDYTALNTDDEDVFSYVRKHGNEAVIVALNMTAQPQTVKFDLTAQGFPGASANALLTTGNSGPTSGGKLSSVKLAPFSVYMGKVVAGKKVAPGSSKTKKTGKAKS